MGATCWQQFSRFRTSPFVGDPYDLDQEPARNAAVADYAVSACHGSPTGGDLD